MVADIWAHLAAKTKFPAWFAKNWPAIEELQSLWQVLPKHVVRSSGYKGDLANVTQIQGIKYDVCSLLGLFLLVGNILQIRGLSLPMQQKALSLLRDLVDLTEWPHGLAILPDLVLRVEEDNQLSLLDLWDALPRSAKSMIRTRLAWAGYFFHIHFD